VAEVHDCFSIAEILMTEAIGWAPQGQGWKLVRIPHANASRAWPGFWLTATRVLPCAEP
jgi:acetyl-CoA acetyltransferase